MIVASILPERPQHFRALPQLLLGVFAERVTLFALNINCADDLLRRGVQDRHDDFGLRVAERRQIVGIVGYIADIDDLLRGNGPRGDSAGYGECGKGRSAGSAPGDVEDETFLDVYVVDADPTIRARDANGLGDLPGFFPAACGQFEDVFELVEDVALWHEPNLRFVGVSSRRTL